MKKCTRVLQNEKGMATLEIVPLLLIFILLLSYTFGAFGVVHSGIKNSISARAYAFETFRNRTNLIYFRDTPGAAFRQFRDIGTRTHGVLAEGRDPYDQEFRATERPIRIGVSSEIKGRSIAVHNERIPNEQFLTRDYRNTQTDVNPVWIMVQYGMCLDLRCGD